MVYRPLLGVAEPTSRIQPGGCESKVTGQKARPLFFFFRYIRNTSIIVSVGKKKKKR